MSDKMGYYYTRDHLGSVREMCSSTGTITSRMAYDSYGRVTVVSGSVLPTMQYTGDYYHATSGLDLTKYRAYDPNTGRWLSRDRIEEAGGINLYDYVNNDSTLYTDTDGLSPTFDITPGHNSGHMSQDVDITVKGCNCDDIEFKQWVSSVNTLYFWSHDNPDGGEWYNKTAQGPGSAGMNDWPGSHTMTYDNSELHGPTIAPEVPTKNKRRNQLLGYEHTPRGLSLPTSNKTAKRLAHLMPLSQLTKSVVEGSFTLNTRIERRSWLRLLLLCRFPVKQNELGCQHSLFEK